MAWSKHGFRPIRACVIYMLFYKTWYHSVVTHALYYFCDTSFINACAIFCSLKFHVVCTYTFLGDIICLLTNRENDKIVTHMIRTLVPAILDLRPIVMTYDCWHCFLLLTLLCHALEMTLHFSTQVLSFFVFLLAQPFSLRCHPPPPPPPL